MVPVCLLERYSMLREEDSIEDVQPRTPDKENPELHRQENVKHEECLHAIDERKMQGKYTSDSLSPANAKITLRQCAN
jgi:hypothetical protein